MGRIKNIVSVAVTCIFLGVCISKLGYFVRPINTDGAYSQIETFHSLPDDSLEVIILGSSRAYNGVDPLVMYDEYGIGAYNYGWIWQRCNTINLFLKDTLETQSPKVVLIEAWTLNIVLQNVDMTAEIYYSRYLHNESAKLRYIKQCFGKDISRYVSYYMPLYAFHDNWSSMSSQRLNPLVLSKKHRKNMGFSTADDVTEIKIPDYHTFEQLEFTQASTDEILEMIELCHERGADVIFFTLPCEKEYKYSKAMKKIAGETGCVFLDLYELAEEAGLSGATDFKDEEHMNTTGARKTASYLGRYIIEHQYDVTDFRTEKGNLWETAKEMPMG